MAIQQGARRLLRKAAISDGGLEMEKLNVAIADDNEKMIDLLETLIKEDNELELVGHANNGADIYDCCTFRYHYAKSRRADRDGAGWKRLHN